MQIYIKVFLRLDQPLFCLPSVLVLKDLIFFAVLSLCCCKGVSLVVLQGLLMAVASLVVEHRL